MDAVPETFTRGAGLRAGSGRASALAAARCAPWQGLGDYRAAIGERPGGNRGGGRRSPTASGRARPGALAAARRSRGHQGTRRPAGPVPANVRRRFRICVLASSLGASPSEDGCSSVAPHRPAADSAGPPARTWRGHHDRLARCSRMTPSIRLSRSPSTPRTPGRIARRSPFGDRPGRPGGRGSPGRPGRGDRARVAWDRLEPASGLVGAAAGRSTVTVEPGGQFELSGAAGTRHTSRAVAAIAA